MFKRLLATASAIVIFVVLASRSYPVPVTADTLPQPVQSAPAVSAPLDNSVFLPMIVKNYMAPLSRFGADVILRQLQDYTPSLIQSLRIGWYNDFSTSVYSENRYGFDFFPTIKIKQLKYDSGGNPTLCRVGPYYIDPPQYTTTPTLADIGALAANYPGHTWVVGNEMERIDWDGGGYCAGQDESTPEEYAIIYHDVYTTIKTADPTARVAIGGMVEFTPLRQQYLDRIWAAYQNQYGTAMPVDVWNIHVYVFNEVSCTYNPTNCWGANIPATIPANYGNLYSLADTKDFTKAIPMIVALRTWMKNHGQQGKPLITNEYGAIMPEYVLPYTFSSAQIRDSFMYPSFNYFLNTKDTNIGMPSDGYRLMQRWAWWSLDRDDGYYSNGGWYEYNTGYLFNSGFNPTLAPRPMGLSNLGVYWINYVNSLGPGAGIDAYPDLAPALVPRTAAGSALSGHYRAMPPCATDAQMKAWLSRPLPDNASAADRNRRIDEVSRLTGGSRLCPMPK